MMDFCDFITGVMDDKYWKKLCKMAAYGNEGLWGVELNNTNITGCPAVVGVVLPSWKRFQIIRGEYGITFYGEDETTVSNAISSFYSIVGKQRVTA